VLCVSFPLQAAAICLSTPTTMLIANTHTHTHVLLRLGGKAIVFVRVCVCFHACPTRGERFGREREGEGK